MGKTLRSKWGFLVLAAALVVGMATIPAVGEHAPEEVDRLQLHLGTDGNYFRHVPVEGPSLPDQTIGINNNCTISTNGSLATFQGRAGYHNQSLGIKTGGSQGVPCSRIDTNEQLGIKLVGVPNATAADFDLELKGAVHLVITASLGNVVVGTFNVYSGSFVSPGSTDDSTVPFDVIADPDADCRGNSDSGPDSGANDNCRVTIDPGVPFDTVTFKPVAGEVSLEGSGDFGNDPARDTIFYLETESWEGELGCTEGNNSTGVESDGLVISGEIIRYENTDGSECVLKPYNLDVLASDPTEGDVPTVTFEVDDPGSQPAIYRATLVFEEDMFTTLQLQYDSDGSDGYDDYKNMPACVEDPFDTSDDPAGSLNNEAIPAGHEGCVINVSQSWDGFTTWDVIFEGDWRFK